MSGGKATGFRGNKAVLPTRDCHACGLPMVWRKAWARNWAQVKYCSVRCRASAKSRKV